MSFDSPERSRHTVKHFVRIGPLMSYELRYIGVNSDAIAHPAVHNVEYRMMRVSIERCY